MNCWELSNLECFESLAHEVGEALLQAPPVDVGKWQSQDVSNRPEMLSYELAHTRLEIKIGTKFQPKLAMAVGANMPWAEDHFQERVGGEPLNPPPSEQWWPYAVQGNAAHKSDEKFSHTYPERFWPKNAGQDFTSFVLDGVELIHSHRGIRYPYGDLNDVVNQLVKDPATRQAYLPIWFPEDTGAVEGQRVPCTLGYHLLQRGGQMDIEYHIRSCDYMRHWRDDVYMAGRLLQWVCDQVEKAGLSAHPRKLIMNIGSFHIFEGDRVPLTQKLKATKAKLDAERYSRIAAAL
jgi:hypothetical protein